ncbi:MAG TPA: dihydrofolate reductase [Vicinamibacterales bacterium]|nr:dihydrofolate reductase [Vicinamibacterales bacterium]
MISVIVAMARNRVIGANGKIPWHLPNELKMFKRLTMGHHIVMGRKTYESINRLLPGRTTVIVTRQRGYSVPGAIVAHSFDQALHACVGDDEVFVIGGADIFREALPIASTLHLTIVDAEPAGDVVMPEIDLSEWKEVSAEAFSADDSHAFGYRYSLLARRPTTDDRRPATD